jgi:uncharacterized membrane protein (UPF0127 family)
MPGQVLITNTSQPHSRPIQARYCASFGCQFRGLMFRRNLPPGQGLLLVQHHDSRMAASIHMLFMRIDLAVVWINSANQVVDVRLARRWRPAYLPVNPARYVLEVSVEHLRDFNVGDQVSIENLD